MWLVKMGIEFFGGVRAKGLVVAFGRRFCLGWER